MVRCDKMTAQKIYTILFSSIIILLCVRIAHTAPAKQQDSSEFKIINLCLLPKTTINVASNDTGFTLTSNCTSKLAQLFELNYRDADANDAEVIFGWSSTSRVSISTGENGQVPATEVTANESYWKPNQEKVYYFPYGHSVTLTVYKGCSISRVMGKSVKTELLPGAIGKQNFTCEGSNRLVNNMNQFPGSQVLSCNLKTRTWEDYDVTCNGPLRCVDPNNDQNPSGCEVWRVHENAGVNVTCSNANSADEPSFNLTCENRPQVLGIMGSSFRSEVSSLEVTCKEANESTSWITSTKETIPQPSHWGCLDPNEYQRTIEAQKRTIRAQNTTITKQKNMIGDQHQTIGNQHQTIGDQVIKIVAVSAFLGFFGVYAILVTVAACKFRKRILSKKQAKTKSHVVTPMGLVDGPSPVRPESGTTYHVLERYSSALLTRNTAYEDISDLTFERKRTDVAGEYASNDMHAPKPTEAAGLYEVVNLDNNGQLQKVAVSQPKPEAQPEMSNETYASVNKIGRKSRTETQADAELKQIEQTQPSNENDYQHALPERNLTQSSPNETG